jgi:hypothetical protein
LGGNFVDEGRFWPRKGVRGNFVPRKYSRSSTVVWSQSWLLSVRYRSMWSPRPSSVASKTFRSLPRTAQSSLVLLSTPRRFASRCCAAVKPSTAPASASTHPRCASSSRWPKTGGSRAARCTIPPSRLARRGFRRRPHPAVRGARRRHRQRMGASDIARWPRGTTGRLPGRVCCSTPWVPVRFCFSFLRAERPHSGDRLCTAPGAEFSVHAFQSFHSL